VQVTIAWSKFDPVKAISEHPASLVKHGINFITLLHLKLVRSLLASQASSIKQKCYGVEINGLPVTIGIHKFAQLSTPLNPKKYFIPILAFDLQIDVSSLIQGLPLLLLSCWSGVPSVIHTSLPCFFTISPQTEQILNPSPSSESVSSGQAAAPITQGLPQSRFEFYSR
jgi:hypothetical protein